MDGIPVLDVKLGKVTCFKPGGNDFSTNQARRPAWPEIPGENTEKGIELQACGEKSFTVTRIVADKQSF